jgi:hypothetical protein
MDGSVWTGEPQRKRAETEGQMVKGNQIAVEARAFAAAGGKQVGIGLQT